MIDPSSLQHRDTKSTPHIYDIETGTIINATKDCWRNFDRNDLIKLNNSLEDILQQEKIIGSVINKDDKTLYFEKVLVDYNAESSKISNKDFDPIRSFYIAGNRNSNVLELLDAEVTVVLEAGHTHFKEFFAYRLATLPSDEIKLFLTYQFEKSFNENIKTFNLELKFILADFSRVLVDRKAIIEIIFQELFPETISLAEPIKNKNTPAVLTSSEFKFNNEKLKDIFDIAAINNFLEVEKDLMANGYIDNNGRWADKKNKRILVSLILMAFLWRLYVVSLNKNKHNHPSKSVHKSNLY